MLQSKKVLGVIGGLGPIATAHFMELIVCMTDAQQDQEHLDMIVYHTPSIPDRSSYILDHSLQNPLNHMVELGQRLSKQQVACIAIPCVTAHYFYEELSRRVSAPIIHAVEETAMHLKSAGIHRAGIMATDGTIASRLFQNSLERLGITPIIPSSSAQRDVMHLIFECIKVNRPADMEKFHHVVQELRQQGAEVIILGCTELSLIKWNENIGCGFLDVLEILAQQSILRCGATLKAEYRHLITK